MLLKRTPLPFCGVALGLAALGNLLSTYPNGATIKGVCGTISALILLWLLIRFVSNFNLFVEELKNPVMGSIIGTYCMALMILGGYKWLSAEVGRIIWWIGLILHVILIIYQRICFQIWNQKSIY